jgi:hypothetical protein
MAKKWFSLTFFNREVPSFVSAILFFPPRRFFLNMSFINPAVKQAYSVMPDLIRHPVSAWIPAFAGMTTLMYLVAGVISSENDGLRALILYSFSFCSTR